MNTFCCEGSPTEGASVPKTGSTRTQKEFAALSSEGKQQFVEFLALGRDRHEEDLRNINRHLDYIKTHFGISPTGIYIATWIEVRGA